MYFEHFGLTTSPFNNTPDPRFFFNTPDHEEALASLIYAVEERKGFVLVSGEVGAGKTLLSRIVLNKLNSNVKSALITHTRLTGSELLASICHEFEIDLSGKTSAAEYMRALEDFLLEQYARNKLAVVIIDEAQNLPFEALEELRMLGNLEADDAKLLQVLLLGQPEVQDAFRHPALKQTYQRIFRTFHLKALDRKLTQGYIEHRLEIAGLQRGKKIFELRALDAIFEYTEGIPRLINQICDNALLAAYSDSRKIVTAETIREVVEQMMSLTGPSRPAESPKAAPAIERAAAPAPAARPALPIQPGPSITDATSRIARQDEYLKGVADRLDAFERNLRDAKQQVHSIDNKQQTVQNDVASARKLHEQAAELFGSVTTNVRAAEQQMKEMLERARRTADAIQSRAMANLGASQKQNVLLREQTRSALDEVQNFTKDQQNVIARLLEDGRKEVEAAREFRKQAAELCQRAVESQATAEQRFRIAIEGAGEATRRTERDAKALLAETREQNIVLQDQLRKLLTEIQTKNDSASQRAAEFLAQQRKEVEKAQHYFDEYSQRLGERAAEIESENAEVLTFLKSEAKTVVEQIHDIRNRTQSRAEQVGNSADEFLRDMTQRIETAHTRITDIVAAADERIKNATTGLTGVKDRILADAEDCRTRSGKLLGSTEELLTATREQCSSLLAEMRTQAEIQTKKAEQILQTKIEDGTSTLNAITAKLAEARKASDQSRDELEALVRSATGEMLGARNSLDATLTEHRSEVARLSRDAAAIKVDFQIRFEEARDALDAMIKEHRSRTSGRVQEVVRDIDERMDLAKASAGDVIRGIDEQVDAAKASATDVVRGMNEQIGSARSGAEERVRALRDELVKAGETADRISTDLGSAIELAQAHIRECQAKFSRETESVQKQLSQLVERNKSALDATRTQVDGLTRQAGETAGTLRAEINLLKDSARLKIESSGKEFEQLLAQSTKKLDTLRHESMAVAGELTDRMVATREDATKAVAETEEATGALRQQSRNSLAEVRTCLLQMGERADQIRRELSTMGDDIRESAKSTSDQIQRTGDRVATQIETMREAAQRDADANHKRLALVRQQVEQSAEQMRENAAKLLDQVQNGASSLRRHADDLLAQAQSGSEKLSESAAVMLTQAQTASEKFREQAEALLHRAEATASAVRGEVQTLRTEISSDSEQIRQQITAAKHDLAETRQDTSRIASDALATQQRSQSKAEQLIKQAESVQKHSESLLSMPKELVEEAKRQALALSDMSKKVSTVVRQLSTAESKAVQNKSSLDEASTAADEKLGLLKRHTERLGQLVGIIRQLYGTMDARIERLRGRLLQVDDLVRNVPRDIQNLKAAFDTDDDLLGMRPAPGRMNLRGVPEALDAPAGGGHPMSHKGAVVTSQDTGAGALVMAPPRTAAAVRAKTQAATKPAGSKPASSIPVRKTPPKSSLGEVIQRNPKLNEWLQNVLGEVEAEEAAGRESGSRPNRTNDSVRK